MLMAYLMEFHRGENMMFKYDVDDGCILLPLLVSDVVFEYGIKYGFIIGLFIGYEVGIAYGTNMEMY